MFLYRLAEAESAIQFLSTFYHLIRWVAAFILRDMSALHLREKGKVAHTAVHAGCR